MARHFRTLVRSAVADPENAIERLAMLEAGEIELPSPHRTREVAAPPPSKDVPHVVDEQARADMEALVAAVVRDLLQTDRVGRSEQLLRPRGYLADADSRAPGAPGEAGATVPAGRVVSAHVGRRAGALPGGQRRRRHLGDDERSGCARRSPARRTASRRNEAVVSHPQAIAIVGMAGRFPGAPRRRGVLARISRAGVESIRRFTDDELRQPGIDERTCWRSRAIVKAGARARRRRSLRRRRSSASRRAKPRSSIRSSACFSSAPGRRSRTRGYDPQRIAGRSRRVRRRRHEHLSAQQPAANARRARMPVGPLSRSAWRNDKDYLADARRPTSSICAGPAVNVQTACSTSLVAVAPGAVRAC